MHPAIAQHLFGISAICQRYGIRKLEVFGSAARVDDFDTEQGDADFLVEFAPGVDLIELGVIRNPYVLANINRHRQAIYAA